MIRHLVVYDDSKQVSEQDHNFVNHFSQLRDTASHSHWAPIDCNIPINNKLGINLHSPLTVEFRGDMSRKSTLGADSLMSP